MFLTQANSYTGGASAYVNAVIASVPGGKIYDTPNFNDTPPNSGYYTLSASDFNTTSGEVTWFGAKAFTTYLNNINYGGTNQWRLPIWTDTGASGEQFGYNGTDYGYNVNTNSGELAKLYYDELGKKAYINTSGVEQSGYGIFGNSGAQIAGGTAGPFSNAQSLFAYWSGTEYEIPTSAWVFFTYDGIQSVSGKNNQVYTFAWAVSPGQVAAVPVPGAVWLFGSGLIGLLGLKRCTLKKSRSDLFSVNQPNFH